MNYKKAIGVFDSGYGGLTVLKEIHKLLPQYDFIYLGDNARAPYGPRSFETVYEFTLQSVKELFDMGCPLVILACNTASAKALRNIQQKDLPKIDPNKRVLGVIRPTTEIVGKISKTKNVGVFGTQGTINSGSYPIEIHKFFPEIQVYQQACPMLVPIIENNEYQSEGADYFVKKYIDELNPAEKNIDTIILGCTHYPLLISTFKKYLPENIELISQGEIVAQRLKEYFHRHPELESQISKNGTLSFFTTDDTESFDQKGSVFFGTTIQSKHIHLK